MEIQSEASEASTPGLSYRNASFWRNEDSGYHTSFTPGSIEFSQSSNENVDPSVIQGQIRLASTPASNFRFVRKYLLTPKNVISRLESSIPESPIPRRPTKRPYEDDSSSSSTPTSKIAGGIQKLKMSESNDPSQTSLSVSSVHSGGSDSGTSDLYHLNLNECVPNLSYPTTPVKKICVTSCKLTPSKRSAKKINFAIHSLSCETRGIVKQQPYLREVRRTVLFKPDQKVDIVKTLYKDGVYPPLTQILSYLTNEDIQIFCQVHPLWHEIWNNFGRKKQKEYRSFLKEIKNNQENRDKELKRKNSNACPVRSMKEVHNVLNAHVVTSSPRSPPETPRTNKFKKFTKAASLDGRVQLPCVRCRQPSKVTVEPSGEEWAECTSATCAYVYCRFCRCSRHPGKTCFKYDLEGPSPSKRRKSTAGVCTKKSRRNLHRLMH